MKNYTFILFFNVKVDLEPVRLRKAYHTLKTVRWQIYVMVTRFLWIVTNISGQTYNHVLINVIEVLGKVDIF